MIGERAKSWRMRGKWEAKRETTSSIDICVYVPPDFFQ
jgi:hypothetical protein